MFRGREREVHDPRCGHVPVDDFSGEIEPAPRTIEDDAIGAARAYNELMDEIGLSRDFRALGIETPEHLDTIIRNGFNPQRVENNPRRLTTSALRDMLVELQGQPSIDH